MNCVKISFSHSLKYAIFAVRHRHVTEFWMQVKKSSINFFTNDIDQITDCKIVQHWPGSASYCWVSATGASTGCDQVPVSASVAVAWCLVWTRYQV